MDVSTRQLMIRQSGFTLIELMVTIAVLTIIVSIAAPSISTQLANQRVNSTVSTLQNALKEAKAESIIRRQAVTLTYDSAASPKTISLQDTNGTLSTYDISNQSTVSITPSTAVAIVFQPNKMISGDDDMVYTICDSSSSKETPKQVTINKIANIGTTNSGVC